MKQAQEDVMMSSPRAPRGGDQDFERGLMNRALLGDTEAYGELFELCRAKIHRMAYAILHDSATADDVVQETFLRGLDRISTYRGESAPRAWFSSIALNVCRHRIRESKHLEGANDRTLEAGKRIFRPRTRAVASKVIQQENHR